MIQAAGSDQRSPRSEPGASPLPVDRPAGAGAVSWADRRFWDVVPLRDAVLTLLLLATIAGAIVAGYLLRSVLGPVLVALLVAYAANPVVYGAEHRWRVPRVVSASALALLIVAFEAFTVLWLGPMLVRQTVALSREAPKVTRQLTREIERRYDVDATGLTRPLEDMAPRERADGSLDLSESMRAVRWAVGGTDDRVAGAMMTAVGVAAYVMFNAILFPIMVLLMVVHLPGLSRLINFVPKRRREETARVFRLMNDAVAGFFRGRFVVSLIMCALFAGGWWLCGVPYALVLGVITGLLNVIPWASAIGWPLAVGLAAADGATHGHVDALMDVVWPSVVYVLVQGLDGWVLTPWIQSRSVDVSSVTVLIVVFVGGAVAGVIGLVLAVPIAACLKIVSNEVVMPRVREWAERH
jgi:predicted PurR-regulated permease PerM